MFKIGEKIVCVDPSISLVKGEIYTVKIIRACTGGIMLKEVKTAPIYNGYFHWWRFRKLDYDFAEQVLFRIADQVKIEELELQNI